MKICCNRVSNPQTLLYESDTVLIDGNVQYYSKCPKAHRIVIHSPIDIRLYLLAYKTSDPCSPLTKLPKENNKLWHNIPIVPSSDFLVNGGNIFCSFTWVPRGSVVKCLTRNPGVLGSSRTGSSGFFRGSVLGQDTSEPSLVLVKHRKA